MLQMRCGKNYAHRKYFCACPDFSKIIIKSKSVYGFNLHNKYIFTFLLHCIVGMISENGFEIKEDCGATTILV